MISVARFFQKILVTMSLTGINHIATMPYAIFADTVMPCEQNIIFLIFCHVVIFVQQFVIFSKESFKFIHERLLLEDIIIIIKMYI